MFGLARASALTLYRDPLGLALTFVLPLLLFSIFAAVFGGLDDAANRPVRAAIAVEDDSDAARSFVKKLDESGRVLEVGHPGSRAEAEALVRAGVAGGAIVVPVGFGAALEALAGGEAASQAEVLLLANGADPLASQALAGLVRAVTLELGAEEFSDKPFEGGNALRVTIVDVLGGAGKRPSISHFAAGIGVMFLLFSLGGRSGLLIDERESGVLMRARAAGATLGEVLFAHGVFLALLGALQVTAMFCWGAVAFGLDLFTPRHLAGFALVTTASATAAAAFALVLATACRTRSQLQGVSAVVVLVMSALAGSMVPRFLMPEALQQVGQLFFNAWALDAYQAIFWYESSPADLIPRVSALLAAAAVLALVALRLGRRWERAS